jgi:hypothetical protein
MGKQFRVMRKVASVPVVASGFATVDLPRQYDYESIFMRINGTINVTVAVITSVRAENPCQVVSRAEVIADGKNNIASAPFWFFSLGNYTRDLIFNGARATTPISGVAVAAYVVEAIGVIDLMTVDGQRTKDSNFRTLGLSLFQLRLTFGAVTDSVVVGGSTITYTNMFVDVFTQELVEIAEANDPAPTVPIMLRKVSYQEIALPTSNANQEIRLPAGNLIKSVLLRTAGATTLDEPSTAMLNNAQLAAGVDVRVNLAGANLRAKNNADYGPFTAGYYVMDVTSKGPANINLTDLWDVSGAAEPKAILDVVGGANNKLQAVVTEYIPAR